MSDLQRRRRLVVLGEAAATAWTPKTPGNLYVWLDASKGVYQDAALTTPAVATNDPIGGWADQSGHGNHVTQTTDAKRPKLTLAAIGGKPAVTFTSGSSTFLQRATLADGDLAQTNTVYIVYQQTTLTSSRTVMDGGANGFRHAYYYGGTKWNVNAGTQLVATYTPDKSWHIATTIFKGASSALWIDTAAAASGNANTNALRGLTFGASYTPGDYMTGMICEVLVYHAEHDAATRALVYNCLGAKYGFITPLSLLMSPSAYQVFQRNSSDQANIVISGYYAATPAVDIEASWNGGAYATIASNVNGLYTGTLTAQAAGQGTLTVRVVGTSTTASAIHVGIGDVFLLMGQSNLVGQYTNNQVYSHATLKAGLFGNDYKWHELIDPTDSSSNQIDAVSRDTTYGGSVWPLLATSIMASTGFPVAFIPAGLSNTAIAVWAAGTNHQDQSTLYGSAVHRALQVTGGIKAVLYWQGESDALAGTAQATYLAAIQAIGDNINTDLSVPVLNAKIHNYSGYNAARYNAIQAAIGASWGLHNLVAGADLSGLASGVIDLVADADAATCATAWWTALQAAFSWT